MSVTVLKNSEARVNTGQIVVNYPKQEPMLEDNSAHVPKVFFDDQINRTYREDFFETNVEVETMLCQCE